MSFESEGFELDVELLGLKYDLLNHLTEAGFAYFADFAEIEPDLGNAELKVTIMVGADRIRPAIEAFAKANNFPKVFFSTDKGAFYLRRR